jgi:hypothetical protein
MQQFAWVAVIAGVIVLFWLPVIVAVIRGTDPLWPVVVLTLLTPLFGVTWLAAWIPVIVFTRRRPATQPQSAPQPAPPPWDDPRTLFGGVPSADLTAASPR